MHKLLNRFSWLLSGVLGFIIAFVFIGMNTGTLRSDDIFLSAFWGIILSVFIKRFLLGADFIDSRLYYFKEKLLENAENISLVEDVLNKDKNTITGNNQLENINNAYIREKHNTTLGGSQDFTQELDNKKIGRELIDTEKNEKIDVENSYLSGFKDIKPEKNEYMPSLSDIYVEKITSYIKDFFSTNTLAKIGSILIFLAIIFFLRGVAENFWELIGPIGRLLIGFIISFIILGLGIFLHGRGNKNEGLTLIGLSILINYSVILSGRYLIGESTLGEDGFLTEGITFLLLILNTIFGVISSLVYQSRTLLIFSFFFAYLNPFIIGANSSGTPYTLVGYSLIVSLGGLFLANHNSVQKLVKKKNDASNHNILLYTTFILGNILILAAPFTTDIDWIIKIIASVLLSAGSLYTLWNIDKTDSEEKKSGVVGLFTAAYFFVCLLILGGGLSHDILTSINSSIVYIGVLIGFFFFTALLFKKDVTNSILGFLFFVPLLVWLGIILTGQAFSVTLLLFVSLALYLVSFGLLQKHFTTIFGYCYFVLIGFFTLITDISIVLKSTSYDYFTFFTIISISFIFLFSSYYFSFKKNLSHLYSIGTIFSIFLLAPIIIVSTKVNIANGLDVTNGGQVLTLLHVNTSIFCIILFALSNWILPFFNKNLLNNTKNIGNLIVGSLACVLFVVFELYTYGNVYFPGVAQGIAFLVLAIIYFLQSFFVVQMIGKSQTKSGEIGIQNEVSLKNVFYTYAGISISLFSLAIALIFSKYPEYPEIISTIWLFEATILYYFYSKTKQWKILAAGNVLFIIGISKLALLLDAVGRGDFNFLVSFTIVAASLLLNIWFIDRQKSILGKKIHYVFHIIGIVILGILLSQIITSSGHGWSSLGISIFVTSIGVIYSLLRTQFLKWFFIIMLLGFSIFHIAGIQGVFVNLSYDKMNYLKILQYSVTGIIIANYFIWNKRINYEYSKIILGIIGVYTFIISNLYVLDLFGGLFGHLSLTIYWGIIASVLLFYGIAKDILKFRTIGLYFIILTSFKIFAFDVWQLDNTSSRVIALMGLGILFIMISTFYTNKYGNNILGELSPDNLKDNKQNLDADGDEGNNDENIVNENQPNSVKNAEVKSKVEETKIDKNEKKKIKIEKNNNVKNQNSIEEQEIKMKNKVKIEEQETKTKNKVKIEEQETKIKNKVKSDIFDKKRKDEKSISNELHSDKKIEDNEFMMKLTKVNVEDIKVVRFFPKTLDNFTIRAKNLMRLSLLVIKQTGKTNFESGELQGIYKYVISNYKTNLSRREYDKLRTTIKNFIDDGGQVEIVKKEN